MYALRSIKTITIEREGFSLNERYDYEIYVDAGIDADFAYMEDNGVHLIPMKYSIDGKEFIMNRVPTEEELSYFYTKMKEGSITGTSQITPFTYEKEFGEAVKEGKKILYIALSSGLSSTYSSSLTGMQSVLDEYPDAQIECVDALGATAGIALLMQLAVNNRNAGMSLSDNAECLRQSALKVSYWFIVEDLQYLKRGGRISSTAAFAGNVLNLKPILKINDEGKLINISKQRGVPRGIKYLLECYEIAHDDTPLPDVYVVNANCPERGQKIADEVVKINPNAVIHQLSIGPVIGAHTGPGFVALIHFGNRDAR